MEGLILLVEDNPVDARIMERAIKRLDPELEVITCASSEEAWTVCENTPPDLIISDVHLPGEDGYILCDKVRHKGHPCCDIPFLMVSSDEDRVRSALKSYEAGAYAFEPKPFHCGHFLSLVERGLQIARDNKVKADIRAHIREFLSCSKGG